MNITTKILLTTALGLAAACAMPDGAPDGAPAIDDADLDEAAVITYGAYSADAVKPVFNLNNSLRASATFSGPAASRMGVCALQLTDVPCTTVADCSGLSVPTGGFRYCTNPDNVGAKSCAIRPGPPTQYCAGTPAQGGAIVNPGTYYTPWQYVPTGSSRWVSYACFAGCTGATSEPSVSSSTLAVAYCEVDPPPGCSADYCIDRGCDGVIESCRRNNQKILCN